jgi:hypothetical protein
LTKTTTTITISNTTNYKGGVWMTGQLLAAAGEEGWWRRISLSLSESADFFNSRFWLWHKKLWLLPPVFKNGYNPWDVGHFYFLGLASQQQKTQHQGHIVSTMAFVIVPYDHPCFSNFEYFDQEEQSPKIPGTCAQ